MPRLAALPLAVAALALAAGTLHASTTARAGLVGRAALAQDPGPSAPCWAWTIHLPFGLVPGPARTPAPPGVQPSPVRPCAPQPTATATQDGLPSATRPPESPGAPTATATGPTPTGTRWTATGTPTGTATGPTATASTTPGPSPTGPTASPSPTATGPTATRTPSPTATSTPTATPTPTATLPVVPAGGALGLQVFEGDFGAIQLGRLNQAGATWGRTRALWQAIEPVDGGPRAWGMSDSMIGALAGRGITPMVTIYAWPEWAASTACGPIDRVPLARYQAFVRALVERYDGDGMDDAPGSPRAVYWEIGNEPDFTPSAAQGEGDYGSCFGDDPGAYAELLVASHGAIAAADPTARVLFGGVAFDRFSDRPGGSVGPFRHHFVRDVLEALHQAHGDDPDFPFVHYVGFHNYNDFRNNWDGPDGQLPELMGKAAALRRDQLVVPGRFDLRDIPLVSTEVGIAAGPSDAFTVRNEAYQAAYAGQVAIRALGADLASAIWYTTTDYTTGNCEDPYAWLTFGLLRSRFVRDRAEACTTNPLPGYAPDVDWEIKPALTAFDAASRLLAGAAYDRQLTAAETGDVAIEAHRLTLADGHPALVAFTDHGDRLGRRGSTDLTRDLVVGPALLDGWTGRVRLVDHMGAVQVRTGATVTVRLTLAPVAVVVD